MLPSPRLVRAAIALARWLPAGLLHAAARGAGSLGWVLARRRRATLLANVGHLAPHLDPAGRRRVARRTLPNMFEAAADLYRLPSLDAPAVLALARTDLEPLVAARRKGRGVIAVTGHLGPYELGAAVLAAAGLPVHAMVEDLDPETNRALAAYRGATGVRLVPRNTGVRQLYRLLTEGGIVLLVADRVIGEGSEGMVVPFGDALRAVPTGPGALAVATGAPIVVGHIVRAGPGARHRYLLQLDPPVDPAGRTREDLVRLVAARLNAITIEHPDQWYVFQPDWRSRDPGV